ncbi:MAG: translation initiation factor IF-3, partial [Candidatus Acidiferrum sp.]
MNPCCRRLVPSENRRRDHVSHGAHQPLWRGRTAQPPTGRFALQSKGDSGIPPPDRFGQAPHDRGQRINDQIRISPVRLIGVNGEQLGIVPTAQAQEMAREANLDLVEVAANERPPVCKILDYGKFRYQQS